MTILVRPGRDEEHMDMIVSDMQTATHGLPVTFEVVPFDDPCVWVLINGENTGSVMYIATDIDRLHPEWVSVSTETMKITNHGQDMRAALARHLNEYIDKRVGLLT